MGGTLSLPRLRFDETNINPYEYRPLKGRTIRLLKITAIESADETVTSNDVAIPSAKPASAVDLAESLASYKETRPPNYEVELVHVLLDSGIEYEPISYTWGDPNRCHSLELKDESCLMITKTLKDCLPYLIQASKTLHLWIDQLCINQEDNTEKGHQVAMMGDIYTKGDQTLVWLGLEDSTVYAICEELDVRGRKQVDNRREEFFRSIDNRAALKYVDQTAAAFPVECTLHKERQPFAVKRPIDLSRYQNCKAPFNEANALVCGPCFKEHLAGIRTAAENIFSRPWFMRAWVVQEAVLSPWNIFMIGNKKFTTRDLESIPLILNDLSDDEGYKFLTEKCPEYVSMHEIINMRQFPPGTSEDRSYGKIHYLVSHFRATGIQATNPRDYIYSILGIHPRAGQLFTPDYNLSIRDTYISATRIMLDAALDLDLLALCDNVDRDFIHNLPSWVPDWTALPRVAISALHEYRVSGIRWPLQHPKYSDDLYSGLLQVQGKRLGTISWISKFNTEKGFIVPTSEEVHYKNHENHQKVSRPMLRQLDSIAAEINRNRSKSIKKLRKGSMLWQLNLGVGSKPDDSHISEDICWTYGGSDPANTLRHIGQVTAGRRFCTGGDGILGLVPKISIAGDEIWLIHGSQYVYVLRPTMEDGEYLLLGTGIWDYRNGPSYVNRCGDGWAEYKKELIEEIVLV